jgi:hypothetical protein
MLQTCHSYFAHNLNRHLEFIKLIEMMQIKGLRMFKNVKTRWISLTRVFKEDSVEIHASPN